MAKKELERNSLETLLKSLNLKTDSIVETENPDFILASSGKKIGIEITHLYHNKHHSGPKSRAWEGECENVLDEAAKDWDLKGLPAVHVSVTFNMHSRFKKREVKEHGKKLSDFVSGIIPQEGEQSVAGKYAPESHAIKGLLTPEDYDLIIVNRIERGRSLWSQSTGGSLPELKASFVQEQLSKKNNRIESYREKADAIWLVMDIDDFMYSASFDVNTNAIDHLYHSLFDKVFLISRRNGLIYELEQKPNGKTIT